VRHKRAARLIDKNAGTEEAATNTALAPPNQGIVCILAL